MNNFIIFVSLCLIILLYFRIAHQYDITDKPNKRSSHLLTTIRGGGIVFPFAVILYYLFYRDLNTNFLIGLLLISAISFFDDLYSLASSIRVIIHLVAATTLLLSLQMFVSFELRVIPLFYLIVVGVVNAYNFMDGINGLTGGYSLVSISTLYAFNKYVISFVSSDFLIVIGASLIVFNFFNFRERATCFAGDVGSVSMGFILTFLIGNLVIVTGSYIFILFLLVYGLDSLSTIIFRIIRKENILEPHRSHFYQFLANKRGWSHIRVSTVYALVQLLVNILVVVIYILRPLDQTALGVVIVTVSCVLCVIVRLSTEGRKFLFSPKSSRSL